LHADGNFDVLANIGSLDELRRVFDTKYQGDLKADILKVLKSEKGKAALNKLTKERGKTFFLDVEK
jgi:hypothetical protein